MIRPLGEDDVGVYRQVRADALQTDPDAFGETLEMFEGRSREDLREWFRAHVAPGHRRIFVYEVDDAPQGMCGCGVTDADATVGFLWGLFVSPAVRRRGVGAALIAESTRFLASRGVERVGAKVAAPNDGAIDFYRSLGFQIVERVGVLRDGSDVPVYRIEMDLVSESEGMESL